MKLCYANSSVLTIMIFFKKTCNHNNLTNTEVWLSKNLDLIQTHYLQILTSYNDKYNHCIYHLSAHSLMVTCDLPSHHSHAASVLNGPDFIAGDTNQMAIHCRWHEPEGHPLQVTWTRGPSTAGDTNQMAMWKFLTLLACESHPRFPCSSLWPLQIFFNLVKMAYKIRNSGSQFSDQALEEVNNLMLLSIRNQLMVDQLSKLPLGEKKLIVP